MLTIFRNYATAHQAVTRRQTAADLAAQLSTAQKELSTGFKADVYKSLGVGAAQTLDMRASIDRDRAQIESNALLLNRLDTMAQVLNQVRDTISPAIEIGVANKTVPMGTVAGLQRAARTALESILSQGNSSHSGTPVFSGTESTAQTLQPWNEVNPATGRAPADVLAGLVAGGLPDAATAASVIAQVDAVFGDAAADPATNYEATFYNGAPTGAPRQTATVGDNTVLHYGVQANDAGFRDVIKGLAMLAAVDPAGIDDPAAYAAWVGKAVDSLTGGNAALLDAETRLGAQSGQIETATARMEARIDIYQSRVLDLEGVDSYEAATRISLLETQLQATYAVTARLSQLSFLNYM